MARPVRVEFAGAIYHVLNRGNYRKDLFTVGDGGARFVRALQEASEQCGWRVHAYVVMSNRYHLVVETPEPNLVDGMHWLQTTFSSRFNRSMGERGHVFQGRYWWHRGGRPLPGWSTTCTSTPCGRGCARWRI